MDVKVLDSYYRTFLLKVVGISSKFSRIRQIDSFATSVRTFKTINCPSMPPEDKRPFLCLLHNTTLKLCIISRSE